MTDSVVNRIRAMSESERSELVKLTVSQSGAYSLWCRVRNFFYRYFTFLGVIILLYTFNQNVLISLIFLIFSLMVDSSFFYMENKRTNSYKFSDNLLLGRTADPLIKNKIFKYASLLSFILFGILYYVVITLEFVRDFSWVAALAVFIFFVSMTRLSFAAMRLPALTGPPQGLRYIKNLEEISLQKLANNQYRMSNYRRYTLYFDFVLFICILLMTAVTIICVRMDNAHLIDACLTSVSFFLFLPFPLLHSMVTVKTSIKIAKYIVSAMLRE